MKLTSHEISDNSLVDLSLCIYFIIIFVVFILGVHVAQEAHIYEAGWILKDL